MTTPLDPTLLAAYADGQLTPEEAAKVERHLADSPGDRQAVENLRQMNALLVSAFEEPLRAPLTPALCKQIAKAGRPRLASVSWRVAAGTALAASIALAAGYLVGGAANAPEPGLVAGELAPTSTLNALLETGQDGAATSVRSGTATLSTTFLDSRGAPCRDLEWSGDLGTSTTWAIACRRGERWVVEIAVSRPAAGAQRRDAYVPAAGTNENVMDAALEALEAGPVLGPDDVDLLIGSNWNPQ